MIWSSLLCETVSPKINIISEILFILRLSSSAPPELIKRIINEDRIFAGFFCNVSFVLSFEVCKEIWIFLLASTFKVEAVMEGLICFLLNRYIFCCDLQFTHHFLHPLKISENQRFSSVSEGVERDSWHEMDKEMRKEASFHS